MGEETAALSEVGARTVLRRRTDPDFRTAVGLPATLDEIEHDTVRK